MFDAWVIKTNNLSKGFSRANSYRTLFRMLKGTLLGEAATTNGYRALQGITFEIQPGDKVGLIGNNGAGKSSLLRIIAGLSLPSDGELQVRGQVTLLAALGMGMVDELSLEENVLLYGAICGVDRDIINANLREIIEWAELQEFTASKLKTLSTGMRARLAFSTTRHIATDITLMDEVLTAGDRNFRDKCKAVFDDYKSTDRTFIFASHDTDFVKNVCNKTLWLDRGEQKAFGATDTVLAQYLAANPGTQQK